MSGKFSELNVIVNESLNMIYANQNLCKYLYYETSDPLSESDIVDTTVLLDKNIFLHPKIPTEQETTKNFLTITIDEIVPFKGNPVFREEILSFDIISELNSWSIDDGIRLLHIINELDNMFNNKRIKDFSLSNILFNEIMPIKYSDNYYGYKINYKLKNSA